MGGGWARGALRGAVQHGPGRALSVLAAARMGPERRVNVVSELVLIIITLTAMFTTALTKAITGQLLKLAEKRASEQNQEKARVLGELKMARAQRSVAEQNMVTMEKRKVRLRKRLKKRRKQVKALEAEEKYREKLDATMRDQLIRPTRAAPGH